MTTNQNQIAADFLSRFLTSEPEIQRLVSFVEKNVTKQSVMDPADQGIALEALRDRMGFRQGLLHLATRQKVGNRWVLRRIR